MGMKDCGWVVSTVDMGVMHIYENEESLKKRVMMLESHVVECDAVIVKLEKAKEEVMKGVLADIDRYLTIIKKQRSRFAGDAYSLSRAASVLNEEKRKKEWRENVLLRDGFQCKRCGSTEDITLHHIVPKSICSPELIWDEANGVALCQKCHNEWHAKYGTDSSFVKFIHWLKSGKRT